MYYKGVLAASIALACCAPASAAVVFQTSGTLQNGFAIFARPILAPGNYTVALSFDAPITGLNSDIAVEQRYLLFVNGVPSGGNEVSVPLPFTRVSDRAFGANLTLKAAYSQTSGSIRRDYLDERLTSTSFTASSNAQQPIQFTFTISNAAVPEPATWAMMIGGFGVAGAATRRRRTAQLA